MSELRLHPNMLLGVALPAPPPGGGEGAEGPLLRRLGVRTCMVECAWDELEPDPGRFDAAALDALREQLIRLRALEIEPLLCLWHGREPAWFAARGAWTREDSPGCFVRYVTQLLAAVGHLAAEYLTFAEPNAVCRGLKRGGERSMSAIASAHIRAYKLIHAERKRRGFRDTAVGFALRMRESVSGLERLRLPLPGDLRDAPLLYQQLPLRAMARGEFTLPLRNLTRAEPGLYCNFTGFFPDAGRGRSLRSACAERCCAELLRAAPRPVYYLDGGQRAGDGGPLARYLYEQLDAVCASHQPVLRYYYGGTRNGGAETALDGLFRADPAAGRTELTPGGEFFAALVRERSVGPALYDRYVAGPDGGR